MTDDFTKSQSFDVPDGYELLPWTRGFGRQVGPLFQKQGPDGMTRAFRFEEHHTNGMMNAHGGMMMTFADMAWGAAIENDEDTWWVTIRLLCDFLSGAKHGEFVEGRANIVSEENNLFTVEGRIWTGERTLLTGTGIFKVIERRG
jgi:acyl-coenzyme A thioesterase PaaI-like protein